MKVMVGLSGGVDSAIAAYLLKEEGYEVVCCFMRNWDSIANNDFLGNPTLEEDMCPQEKDYYDAMEVAKKLDLPLLRIDFVKEYWDYVFSYFIEEYKKGRTPNPDIFCNKYIKFKPFLEFALKNGCQMIAMGHYSKKKVVDGKSYLYKATDLNKDQSYFLSQISQEQLSKTLFPLGDLTKKEVREIAKKLNLDSVQDKKDSTGVCFIGERNFKEFLKNYIPAKQGDIVDIKTNKKIGTHDGVLYYTLGQRRGLGVGGIHGLDASGWFVCKKDVQNNILYVTADKFDTTLLSDEAIINQVNLFNGQIDDGKIISAKFRYRQTDQKVKVFNLENGDIRLEFLGEYSAITPGQACVFYEEDKCLGGGIIDKIYYKGTIK